MLVDGKSPRDLALAIGGLLQDDKERGRLSKAARQRVEQRYSLNAMVSGWRDLYQRVRRANASSRLSLGCVWCMQALDEMS